MEIVSTKILVAITAHLSLRDIICLSSTCKELHRKVFGTPTIWTSRVLFDEPITDAAVAGLVPKIPRSYYAIREIRLNHLRLSTYSIFLILNQFGHCMKTLELTTDANQMTQLCTHLEAFAFHLAHRQASNRIPLSFVEYLYDHDRLVWQAQQAVTPLHYADEVDYAKLLSLVQLPHVLDDPPFEELQRFCIRSGSVAPGLLDRMHYLVGYLSQNEFYLTRREEGEIECVAQTDTFWNEPKAHERCTESPPDRLPQPVIRVMRYRPSPKRRLMADSTPSPDRRAKLRSSI
ncbi:hypothetical protein EC973_006713 [Apophysomyces ossiformis]|uniref:F-box domain-containing protein n=1 Tax=Apophysomyces ossiformis TaxID=679940 RepID=A0A8H7ERH3_9FUNG|nr:hypothetical protein EC973_006713 [Apophysomyces ossiformis]